MTSAGEVAARRDVGFVVDLVGDQRAGSKYTIFDDILYQRAWHPSCKARTGKVPVGQTYSPSWQIKCPDKFMFPLKIRGTRADDELRWQLTELLVVYLPVLGLPLDGLNVQLGEFMICSIPVPRHPIYLHRNHY